MDLNNYLLLDDCLNGKDTELPLLDSNILNDLNEQFEIDHFLTPVPSNESECISDFVSTSQNCSFDNISIESFNGNSNQSNDQYNSSSSSNASEIYSPIQITPPETPPSCETSQSSQSNDLSLNRIRRTSTNRFKKSKQNEQAVNKKKKLVPLAPKTNPITIIRLEPTINAINNHQKFIKQINSQQSESSNDVLINNNSLNFNLNDQNVLLNQVQSINTLDNKSGSVIEEKLSKEELSKIREKARRQRNRQSAQLSRQKKADYVKGVERKLEELTDENQKLKKENHTLKDLVNKLTFENNQLKNSQNKFTITDDCLKYSSHVFTSSTIKQNNFLFSSNDTNKTKKTISLLAVIFLIGLNMNLYNDNFKTYESTKRLTTNKADSNVFKGRVLLWSDNLDSSINNLNSSINFTSQNCNPNPISQNETLILESKLRNWAIHQTNKQQQFYLSGKNFNSNFANNKLDDTSNERNRLPWYLGIRNWNQIDGNKRQKLFSTEDEQLNYEQIINSVKPKEDTYYFLSLNPADHLILPLNFYSNSSKGGLFKKSRFSLLIPTMNSQFSANFTSSRNGTKEFKNSSFLQLIEINFEVINMKPIQILKSRFHLNNLNNNNRFINRRTITRSLSGYDKMMQVNSTSFVGLINKPLKSILIRNQTIQKNVQSQQFNKTIGA